MNDTAYKFIISTGLTQTPFENPVFYYCLKDHASFFKKLGLHFSSIDTRMTRDFLVKFASNVERDKFKHEIEKVVLDESKLFGHIDIRECELFITMDYPKEINKNHIYNGIRILDEVVFVAIKNGEHNGEGFLFVDEDLPKINDIYDNHIKNLYGYIDKIFV